MKKKTAYDESLVPTRLKKRPASSHVSGMRGAALDSLTLAELSGNGLLNKET